MQNQIRRWRATWNPDMYHGWGKTRNYFEGWYFKIVDATEQHVFAFIPGISLGEKENQHAFIQVLDGIKPSARYIEYPVASFRPSDQRFELQLEGNYFSAEEIRLDLPGLKGALRFNQCYRWPKMLGAPGIMGWYSFVPFMECYHGIVSVDHSLDGYLEINGEKISFEGGKGYAEKDWGRSFPSSWIWIQSNHFNQEGQISLTASVARIPWLSGHFIGYIVGFLLNGTLYRFATYTGAMMKAELIGKEVKLDFRDRHRRLELIGRPGAGGDLYSPISGEMTGKVNESMQGRIKVKFYENEQLLFDGEGRNAGLEVAGPVEELFTQSWRR